jgi:hypothetical protein
MQQSKAPQKHKQTDEKEKNTWPAESPQNNTLPKNGPSHLTRMYENRELEMAFSRQSPPMMEWVKYTTIRGKSEYKVMQNAIKCKSHLSAISAGISSDILPEGQAQED